MISSPPQEAAQFRGKTLTPESPKPVHYPSPSNIPILEKQMDPIFNEPSLSIGTPASYHSYSQHNQTPSAQSSQSYYTEQQGVSNYHNAAANSALGGASNIYGSGYGSNNQDTSTIQTFASQHRASAPTYSEAASTPNTEERQSYPMSYDPTSRSSYSAISNPNQSAHGVQQQGQVGSEGVVNVQALLDKLSTPVDNNPSQHRQTTASMPAQSPQNSGNAPSISTLPAAPNLPPRPPPQEKPSTHPNYAPEDDIRSYHPHSQKPNSAQYRNQPGLQPLVTQGTPGSVHSNSQYPPMSGTQSNQSPSTPGYRQRDSTNVRAGSADEDIRWPPEINRLYEEFLEDERRFVTDGQWDQFPVGSRLFIGNLPTEKVTKRDIFHRFYRHGKLAQISIKQAYGFVQFLDADSCYRALHAEQGQTVRGRKMHLEISKPQRNTRKAEGSTNTQSSARRRSRSPDYSRGGINSQPGRGVDRYTSNQNAIPSRDRDYRRGRDDYRPNRSPSPIRGGRGGRRDRSRDRFDGRRRSRSRSPVGRGRWSPSPMRDPDDDCPLPRRMPHEVPDVQVIVLYELPRDFIAWVERGFQDRGLRCDVLLLSPRLSEAAVVRRQVLEGVLAISKLTPQSVAVSKINLQLFDRRGGADNVRFDEYADLDPQTAAMLVLHAKQNQSASMQPPTSTQYGALQQTYVIPPTPQQSYPPALTHAQPSSSQAPSNTNLSNLISSLDSNGLQQLLNTMSQSNASHTNTQEAPPPAGLGPDLARLLSQVSAPPTQASTYGQAQPTQPNISSYASLSKNPAFASLLSSQQAAVPPSAPLGQPMSQASPQTQLDMNEIMRQLASYNQ